MTDDAKERVLKQYGAAGDVYIRSKGHAGGSDLDRLVASVRPNPEARALDIATGGGHVAKALAPLVKSIVASDLTPAMLEGAQAFITGSGITNATFEIADAEELPFADGSFEIVTCRIAPHHFPHPDRFVKEVARVLAPGGRFGLIDSTVPDGDLGDAFNRFELARDPSHVRSLPVSAWLQLIEAAGLTIETVEHYPKRHDFADWTDRARLAVEERPAVAKILFNAGPEAAEAFKLERDGDSLIAFTDDKVLFVATK